MAVELLAHERHSLTGILELGYFESQSLTRAFQRWRAAYRHTVARRMTEWESACEKYPAFRPAK